MNAEKPKMDEDLQRHFHQDEPNQLQNLKSLRRLLPPPSESFDDVLLLDGDEKEELTGQRQTKR